jgi:hypothetical protein
MKDLDPAPVRIIDSRSFLVSVSSFIAEDRPDRRGVFRAFCFEGRVIVIFARVPVLRGVMVVRILDVISSLRS